MVVGSQMTDPKIANPELPSEIARCWPIAQAHWSRFLLLNDPDLRTDVPSVAQIALATRQITLHRELIEKYQLVDCIEALLAHEIGHHVKYPGTLAVEARMRMLERSIVPLEGYSLTNVFQDLMINHRLGDELADQFIRIYKAFTAEPAFHASQAWKRDPAFLFYLSLYEAIWDLAPGELIGSPEPEFAAAFPGYRADAQMSVHNLFRMEPNIYTQFLYFVSVMTRYLKPMIDDQLKQWNACQCAADRPTADDWADALTPTDAERQAIDRASRSGWFSEDQADRLRKLNELEERIASLPGFGTDDARQIPDIMAAHYRQLAERHLFRPPPLPRMGDAIVPTTLDEWEFTDPIRDIDWVATLNARGDELGVAQPLKRTPFAELEGYDMRLWQPRMEIYLDVSGSMPNPVFDLNAMTLAAQILTLATTRAGGSVRACLYSATTVLYWSWCRSDTEMSRFLMHYIGGGTDFPFLLLQRSINECTADQPIRIVISDSDFDRNYDVHVDNPAIVAEAIARSPKLVLLLHRPDPTRIKLYRSYGAIVIPIMNLADFPRVATDLAHSLFPSPSY